MFDVISLEDARFTPYRGKPNPGGSIFHGYAYAVLVVKDALDNGVDLKIGMPDLQVRTTANGHPRVEFPKDHKIIRDSRTPAEREKDEGTRATLAEHAAHLDRLEERGIIKRQWVARYFSASRETREAITTLVLALPCVSDAVEASDEREDNAFDRESAAAAASDDIPF